MAEGQKLKEIAALVGKDERTVSKEIMKRRTPKANGRVVFSGDKASEWRELKSHLSLPVLIVGGVRLFSIDKRGSKRTLHLTA